MAGNNGNTFPLGQFNSSYQQIHDAVDMGALNGGFPMILSGMDFRPALSYQMTARTFEVQITLSATSVTSAAMSTTFTANFGTQTSVVLPFTRVNLPAGGGNGSNPNATLWKFPFTTIFPYAASNGNLCWDWRQRSSTSNASTFFDSTSTTPTTPITKSVGTGCTATGQTTAATANLTLSAPNLVAALANGRATSPAFVALGTMRTVTPLWCGTLYVAPAIIAGGITDSSGGWTVGTFPASTLSVSPYAELFMQYAFADAGVSGGVGLSNYAVGGGPPNGTLYVARLWNNTSSTEITGSKAKNGLIVSFVTL
jgi:hypothetical protein